MQPNSPTLDAPVAHSLPRTTLTECINALPASPGLWRFVILLALGGFFELYKLFQTACISSGLVADGFFPHRQKWVYSVLLTRPRSPA